MGRAAVGGAPGPRAVPVPPRPLCRCCVSSDPRFYIDLLMVLVRHVKPTCMLPSPQEEKRKAKTKFHLASHSLRAPIRRNRPATTLVHLSRSPGFRGRAPWAVAQHLFFLLGFEASSLLRFHYTSRAPVSRCLHCTTALPSPGSSASRCATSRVDTAHVPLTDRAVLL